MNSPAFTVAYTVDGLPKSMDFTLVRTRPEPPCRHGDQGDRHRFRHRVRRLDSKPPVVKFLSPLPGLVTNKSDLQVVWTVDSVSQIQKTYEDISAKEGEITITRDAVDDAGNSGSANVIIVRDVTRPIIAFNSPRNGDTISTNPVAVEWTVDGQIQTTQLTETLSGSDGEKTINRTAIDAAGNTDSLTIKVVLDISKPGAPKITVDVVSPTKVSIPTWTWTASGTGTSDFQYKLDSEDFSTGATSTRALTIQAYHCPG